MVSSNGTFRDLADISQAVKTVKTCIQNETFKLCFISTNILEIKKNSIQPSYQTQYNIA